MKKYHIIEMSYAKDGLGISANPPKAKHAYPLFSGSFEECAAKKKEFLAKPSLVADIHKAKEKEEKKEIAKLIKKHK